MKKKFFTITLIIVTFLIATQSCKKDEAIIKTKKNPIKSQIMLRTTADSLLQVKIFNFIDRMNLVRDDPEYEGSEDWNYSLDSTVWYIESALNYVSTYYYRYYSDEEESYISILDSTKTEIDDDGGEYNIVDIQETYDYFLEHLDDYYDDIEDDDKCFLLIDIIGINSNDINARFVFGVIQEEYNMPSWYWGWALGMCNGTNQGIDAADILESFVNGPYPPLFSVSSQFSYYTGISTSAWIYPVNVPTTAHAYGDKMLFEDEQIGTVVPHCLDGTEMGVFLNFLPTIASNYQPSGKITVLYEVIDDFAAQVPETYMIHKTKITYAIYHTGSGSPPII